MARKIDSDRERARERMRDKVRMYVYDFFQFMYFAVSAGCMS